MRMMSLGFAIGQWVSQRRPDESSGGTADVVVSTVGGRQQEGGEMGIEAEEDVGCGGHTSRGPTTPHGK